METTGIIMAIVTVVTNIITGVTSHFLTRKKYNTEVDNNLIANMQKSLDFYKQLSDDNKERLNELIKRNDELELQVSQLREQVFKLMNELYGNKQSKQQPTKYK